MANQRKLLLIFNHQFTEAQQADACSTLGLEAILCLPHELQQIWGNIPPHLPQIRAYLTPIRAWIISQAQKGDYVLIQGDFGACYLMVNFAMEQGLIPIYSTTRREAVEEEQPDGIVKLTHRFQHQIFRKYGE